MEAMATPIFFDGSKMVRISDLPVHQAHLFSGWVNQNALLNFGEKPDPDYVSYENYEFWFRHHFLPEKDSEFSI